MGESRPYTNLEYSPWFTLEGSHHLLLIVFPVINHRGYAQMSFF